ncbi:unnamed protein product [Phytomonas sp. EM1]|nr:unnamed protein product [Phytomonas sp. EM1]|eukprot:CCW62507.1 unnamed protein product [Phytomonas sp. isolate EM1]
MFAIFRRRCFRSHGRFNSTGGHCCSSLSYSSTVEASLLRLGRGVWREVKWRDLFAAFEAEKGWVGEPSSSSARGSPRPVVPLTARKPTLLVSACLVGCSVSYRAASATVRNGSPVHFLLDVLWRRLGVIDCLPICPEMQLLRLPTPRRPIRLVSPQITLESGVNPIAKDPLARVVLQSTEDGTHHRALWEFASTDTLERLWKNLHLNPGKRQSDYVHFEKNEAKEFQKVLDQLVRVDSLTPSSLLRDVDGILLKGRSPSCGVHDARLYKFSTNLAVQANISKKCAQQFNGFNNVDGFFTNMLRNSLQEEATTMVAPPITSELFLRYLAPPNAVDDEYMLRGQCSFMGTEKVSNKEGDYADKANWIKPEQRYLTLFLDAVLNRFEMRTTNMA